MVHPTIHTPLAKGHTASKPPSDKGARRRIRILMLGVFCFLAWAGVTFVGQMGKYNASQGELERAKKELAIVREQNAQQHLEKNKYNDDDFIKQKARSEYQMTGEGETLYKLTE